jgi:hypothetical protein
MFYTDTNGQTPGGRCLALLLLEAAMDTLPLYEVQIEDFNNLRDEISEITDNLFGENNFLKAAPFFYGPI